MSDESRVYALIKMCSDPQTSSDDRKKYYQQAVEICRNPRKHTVKFDGFQEFWDAYPISTSKATAEKSYQKARLNASKEEIMEGLKRYKSEKPDKIAWAYAATWLNQKRWTDYAPAEFKTLDKTHWKDWHHRLSKFLSEAQIESWFVKSSLQDGILYVDTRFQKDWIERNYNKPMESLGIKQVIVRNL